MRFDKSEFTFDRFTTSVVGISELSRLGIDIPEKEIYIGEKKFIFSHHFNDNARDRVKGIVAAWVYYSEDNVDKVTIFNK